MKLISMTNFVLNAYEEDIDCALSALRMHNYANFLKQTLTLGMFVPCNENGNVLKIPTKENSNNTIDHDTKLMDYNDAKLKVLFNNFYLDETYKREPKQLPYLTNGKISVFLHSDFAIRHQFIEDLVGSDLDLSVSF